MKKKERNNFWKTIGIVSLSLLVAEVIKQINEDTSTKLYDQKALKDLEDKDKFQKIYGRAKGPTTTSA